MLGQFNYPGETPIDGLPTFEVRNQNGGTNMASVPAPAYGSTWGIKQALSVQWLHAIAPKANIVLIETNSESTMLTGVETARNYPGVTVVCTSVGPDQNYTSAQLDSVFTTPAFHPNVTFVAAAGNDGSQNSFYSAFSPNVLAVGSTTLSLSGDNSIAHETGWILGGGGQSSDELEPAYQSDVQNSGMRQMPDVAFLGDPETGVALLQLQRLDYGGKLRTFRILLGRPDRHCRPTAGEQGDAALGRAFGDLALALLLARHLFQRHHRRR